MVKPVVSDRMTSRTQMLASALETASAFARTPRIRDYGDVALILRPYLELAIDGHADELDARSYFIVAAETCAPGVACAAGEYDALLAALHQATATEMVADTGTDATANDGAEYSLSQRLWIAGAFRAAVAVLKAYPAIENDVTALGMLIHPAMLRATAATEDQDASLAAMGTLLDRGDAMGWQGRTRREGLLAAVRASLADRVSKTGGGRS